MKTAPIVRSALPGDLDGVLLLYRQLIPDDEPVGAEAASRAWSAMLAMPGMTVFVANLPGVTYPVATCTLLVVPNLTRGARSQGYIENVVTHAAHRKQGFGRAVLDVAIASAWRQGCYRVMLTTGVTEENVLRFYGDTGFARGTKTIFEMRASGM